MRECPAKYGRAKANLLDETCQSDSPGLYIAQCSNCERKADVCNMAREHLMPGFQCHTPSGARTGNGFNGTLEPCEILRSPKFGVKGGPRLNTPLACCMSGRRV